MDVIKLSESSISLLYSLNLLNYYDLLDCYSNCNFTSQFNVNNKSVFDEEELGKVLIELNVLEIKIKHQIVKI